jgi:serine/threonine-protein kinase
MDLQHNLVGQTLAGRYRLAKLIGQGGMGSVYQAVDHQMSNRVIAVKVLAPHLVSDDKQVARFEQEARAASQLRHPNTISVLDFGRSPDGHIFMVIEFLTGETLTNVLRRGRIETTRALFMMRQVCKSLAEAHSKGIIHRDLKPDNIFVCEIYGEKDFIKVIDFGIAKFLEAGGQELTQAGKMFGTPRYLSPEQAQGLPLTAASDLYALGVILFEMLSGRPPFVAEDPIAVAIKHVQEAPPSFSDVAPDVYVPDDVDGIVFRLLSKKPQQRYQSAEEVVAALDLCIMALSGGMMPSGHFTPVKALTPARPASAIQKKGSTIPPPSMSRPGEGAVEETRAMDGLGPLAATVEPDRTLALDSMPQAAGSSDRTMALDTTAGATNRKVAAPQLTGFDNSVEVDEPKPRRTWLYVLGVAVLAAVVAVVVAFSGRDGPAPVGADVDIAAQAKAIADLPSPRPSHPVPKPEPDPEPEPVGKPEAAPAAAREYSITVESIPPGASATLEGVPAGRTPVTLKLGADAPNRELTLELEGFEPYKLETSKLLQAATAGVVTVPAELKAKAKVVARPVNRPIKKPKASDWE